MRRVLLALTISASLIGLPATAADLTGSWTLTSNAKKPDGTAACTERWTFGPGGKGGLESGSEKAEFTWRTEDKSGHTLLGRTKTKTNRAPDCTGDRSPEPNGREVLLEVVSASDGTVTVCPPPRVIVGVTVTAGCFARMRRAP